MFSRHFLACPATVSSRIVPSFQRDQQHTQGNTTERTNSSAMHPLTYTTPLWAMAWLYGPMAAGACSEATTSLAPLDDMLLHLMLCRDGGKYRALTLRPPAKSHRHSIAPPLPLLPSTTRPPLHSPVLCQITPPRQITRSRMVQTPHPALALAPGPWGNLAQSSLDSA